MSRSALYAGRLTHVRAAEPRHTFAYPVLYLLLDLDELDALQARLALFGWNRARPFSFHERDHLAGDGRGLRPALEELLRARGVEPPGGRIELMTLPRVLGYVFNPVSFFWCFDREERLRACVAEVDNTFGDRQEYVLPLAPGAAPVFVHKKLMHVSPFFEPRAGSYRFELPPPGERAELRVDLTRAGVPQLLARLMLFRQPLSDSALLRALLRLPLPTLGVTAAIHFEALRLWWKRAPVFARPPHDSQAARGGPA